ncbi:TldD/PmbA family protein [Spirochaetota bacterium]
MIENIKNEILKKANWYDIYETDVTSTPVSFKNSRIHSLNEKQNSGYGIRVNHKGRTGFSYTNNWESIEDTFIRALELSRFGDEENFLLPDKKLSVNIEPYEESVFDIHDEIEKCESSIGAIKSKFPKANVDCGVNNSMGRVRILNSRGIDSSYRDSHYSVSLSASYILEGGVKIDVWESKISMKSTPMDDLEREILRKIELASNIRELKSGKVKVLLTPKAFTSILRIVASGLNAKSVWKRISPFAGELGKKKFNKLFSLIDDPLLEESPFSYPFDDEGVASRKKHLINCGIIENFVTDLKHAEKLGIEPMGNGSRGYSSLPSPSFSNIIIGNGKDKYDDIIKNIDSGILVEQFIGLGQSNTLTGDFSANLDLAFKIENGELTGRVKDCMISDNLFKLLEGDIILSSEREQKGSVLAPYILFPRVNFTG